MKTALLLTQPNEDQAVTSSLQFDVIIIELQIAGFGFVQFKPDLVSERAGSTFSHFAPLQILSECGTTYTTNNIRRGLILKVSLSVLRETRSP